VEAARAATTSDLPAVLELAAAMRRELDRQRGGELWLARDARAEPLDAAYAALVAADDATVVVGTIDGAVVGFATIEVETMRDGRTIAVVRDLYVDPDARAVGVGEAIGEHITEFARAAGCVGIDAYALPGARETKNFFERSGFTARALVMHKRL
jgi:GNAT superfamily N-acetyltransferase